MARQVLGTRTCITPSAFASTIGDASDFWNGRQLAARLVCSAELPSCRSDT
jgi:hypothetical protein